MRKIVFILALLFTLHCNAQNNSQKRYVMEEIMKMPEFNADYEFLDRDSMFFGKDPENQKREHKKRIVGNDTLDCSATKTRYEEYDRNRKLRRYFYQLNSEEMLGYDYSINQLIGVFKHFYKTGGIKTKGIYCRLGFAMGLWYHYDLDGNLIRTENFEEGFEFMAEDIFSYCLSNKIPLQWRKSGAGIEVRRGYTPENKPVWGITYPDYTKMKEVELLIDGKTGEIIRTIERDFPTD